MSVRIKMYSTNAPEANTADSMLNDREYLDDTLEQRTVLDSEGYQYVMSPNSAINFADDGRGIATAAGANGDKIVQDTVPFGTSVA